MQSAEIFEKGYDAGLVKIMFFKYNTLKQLTLLMFFLRFNRLIKRMRTTLSLLRKALAGEIGMDAILDNVAYSLFNGQLPQVWRGLAPATCKGLGGWMDHFIQRAKQYTDWVIFFFYL